MPERISPYVPASQIEYLCTLCGFRGRLSERPGHRAICRGSRPPNEKKRRTKAMTECKYGDGEIIDGGDRWIHVGEIDNVAHEFGMDPQTGGVTMIAAVPK